MISIATTIKNNIYISDFNTIWSTHRNRIKRCCYKWLNGNPDQINDAMSLASEKAYRYYLSESEPIKNHFSWLYKLTYNICIDIHRGQARQQDIVNEVTSLPDNFYFSANTSESLDEQMDREFAFDVLMELISELPQEMRLVVKYRFIDDLEYQEIAVLLDTNQANVRKKVQLIRQRLREQWTAHHR